MGITLDTYWVQAAGRMFVTPSRAWRSDWIVYILKDMAVKGFEQRMAAVGREISLGKILKLLQRLGTTRYLLAEQDNCYGEIFLIASAAAQQPKKGRIRMNKVK